MYKAKIVYGLLFFAAVAYAMLAIVDWHNQGVQVGSLRVAGASKDTVQLDPSTVETLVNIERSNAGLAPLAHNDALQKSACAKLDDMLTHNYWAHVSPTGTQPWPFFVQAGYNYVDAAENLAYGQPSEAVMVDEWMKSPAHKKNIMGDYKETGICTKVSDFRGGKYNVTVQHFGNR